MGCFRKDNESLQITFNAAGPLRGMQVIAESGGVVKGKVGNVLCDLPIRADGKLDVGRAVGPGEHAP
jgi:molecular chaperone Hsp33